MVNHELEIDLEIEFLIRQCLATISILGKLKTVKKGPREIKMKLGNLFRIHVFA